jgi:hypothetical protein
MGRKAQELPKQVVSTLPAFGMQATSLPPGEQGDIPISGQGFSEYDESASRFVRLLVELS